MIRKLVARNRDGHGVEIDDGVQFGFGAPEVADLDMGVIHLGDGHPIGIAFHDPLGQVVVVSAPVAEQPIPIEGTALIIEGHGVGRDDLTLGNTTDHDRV